MDSSTRHARNNPRAEAGPFSVLFFWWTKSFFKICYKKVLTEENLHSPLKTDLSRTLGDELQKQWDNAYKKHGGPPSLLKILFITFRWKILELFVLVTLFMICRLCQPVILGKVLEYFQVHSKMPQNEMIMYSGILAIAFMLMAFVCHHHYFKAVHYGMQMRVACGSLIYRKSLRLGQATVQDAATGQLVNLLSNDVARFDRVFINTIQLPLLPFAAAFIAFQLWNIAQWAGIIGFFVVICITALQGCLGNCFSRLRYRIAQNTDARIKLMTEIISAIQVIKMYTWEKPFSAMVTKIRRKEVRFFKLFAFLFGILHTLLGLTDRCGLFGTVTTVILLGGHISIDKIYVMYIYFNILTTAICFWFMMGIVDKAETLVSVKRLQEFMVLEEFNGTTHDDSCDNNNPPEIRVKMENVTAKWRESEVLSSVTFTATEGQLVIVIGQVGSGKSSLLQTILGELPVSSGKCSVRGKVSYASQDSWIFGATVRQNIVFGSSFDKERYNDVVNVCALQRDFRQFPQGDLSLVGDRGITLSGGQKARINLARAVYKNADVYLFDDPLSAVDTHVGKHLFHECINRYLKHKIRILVTHQLQYLQTADHIIVLQNGKIKTQGSYSDVTGLKDMYANFLGLASKTVDDYTKPVRIISQQSLNITDDNQEQKLMPEISAIMDSVTSKYLRAGASKCFIVCVFLLYILSQLTSRGADYWLAVWTIKDERISAKTTTENVLYVSQDANQSNTYYLYNMYEGALESLGTLNSYFIYAGIFALQIILQTMACFGLLSICVSSSEHLHSSMFNSVIRTRFQFFIDNPTGRILNRFSKDLGIVDETIPKGFQVALQALTTILGNLLLVAVLNYKFIFPIILLCVSFWWISRIYLISAAQIKTIEGTSKSPVFTHMHATLQGLSTVRAYGSQQILVDEFDRHQDVHTSSWFMFISTYTAFGFFVDFLCAAFIGIIILSTPFLDKETYGPMAGLVVTQGMSMTLVAGFGLKMLSEVLHQMTSVARIVEYTQLEEEPMYESPPDNKPPDGWPGKGEIEFVNTSLKYTETGKSVLADINLCIRPMEKVGIVGRTGAGKSSLISTLFRLALVEGSVKIDGLDTKYIGLHDLRCKISIIPQDPVLFSGTIRKNLDPFEKFSDNELWQVLEEVELKKAICSLDMEVADSGSNFSVGQRQLMCLARAILRKNKILILDEATANVDPHTDSLIQKKVREKFANCTVLTIAHRLNTIVDSSKVLVIDAGKVMEFDHPHLLLQNRNGHFSKMVQNTGIAMSEQLRYIAENNYEHYVTRL
ncbi:ATP-binding cassette sub-family C member 4-like isoform X2 [Periplaneta americana]|uniref:ATP-binding cassette sub-family C member 4-like isoform X2 n=1 Tax=Periplaneta americana TaxID=6978 RepID=UPI0037E7B574